MLQVSTSDYWLSPSALSITLNALGDHDYVQSSVTSGAKLLCYINHIDDEDLKSTFGYDAGHNYRRWSLRAYPTAFGSTSEKYVYLRIPRTYSADNAIAEVVYPPVLLDIYGRIEVQSDDTTDDDPAPSSDISIDGDSSPSSTSSDSSSDSSSDGASAPSSSDSGDPSPSESTPSDPSDETTPEPTYEQYADDTYYYLYLGGHISASTYGEREWLSSVDTGLLATDQDIAAGPKDTWYRYDLLTDTVTFLKTILEATFTTLKATTAELSTIIFGGKTLTGTAKVATIPSESTDDPSPSDPSDPSEPTEDSAYADPSDESSYAPIAAAIAQDGTSDEVILTPAAASQRYISRITDDSAFGNITFRGTITAEQLATFKSSVSHESSTSSDTFVTGMTGSGWNISRSGDVELQSLTIREFLEVPELRFNRAQILIGTNIQSPCGGIIKNVYPLSENEGIAELELGDDDIAGSISVGDLCWGYFHDYGEDADTNNATSDSDDHKGEINYKGFATVYFQVSEILNANSTRFRYELRPDVTDDEDPKQKYTLHPYVGMHFGGRGNTTNKDRQGFTITTPNYTAVYQLVSSWDWSDVDKYIVRVSGKLDGFEALANYPDGSWSNHYGTIDCNFYLRGTVKTVENIKRYLYITQESNGLIGPGETERVIFSVRDHYFRDVTDYFSFEVNGITIGQNDNGEYVLEYKYESLTNEINTYSVVAISDDIDAEGNVIRSYRLEGRYVIRKLAQSTMFMDIGIDGDNLLALGESKRITFHVKTAMGYDMTDQVWKWKIDRGKYDSDGAWIQSEEDKAWGARDKPRSFARQSYVSEASIMIAWSSDVTENDLDPDITVSSTSFRVTATIGESEVTETIDF